VPIGGSLDDEVASPDTVVAVADAGDDMRLEYVDDGGLPAYVVEATAASMDDALVDKANQWKQHVPAGEVRYNVAPVLKVPHQYM
jgi:hypothetical protein